MTHENVEKYKDALKKRQTKRSGLGKELKSLGFTYASLIEMDNGVVKEMWARSSSDGPVTIEVTYPPKKEKEKKMSGLHECPHCHYKFEDAESLESHDCPEAP